MTRTQLRTRQGGGVGVRPRSSPLRRRQRVWRSLRPWRLGVRRSGVGRQRHGERGSATLLVLVLTAVVTVIAVAGAAVGGVLVAQRRAASAADLAALAGAGAIAGPGAPAGSGAPAVPGEMSGAPGPPRAAGDDLASACDTVARIAAANGAQLSRCAVSGPEVTVELTVLTEPLHGLRWRAVGRARAGPVGDAP